MKDWERAELWVRRVSERYPDTSLYDWIFFCKRTGHGDVGAACDFVEQFFAAYGDRPDIVDPEKSGYFYWLAGSPRKALANFRKAYETKTSITAAFALVLMADELGDTAQRDAVIDELCTRHRDKAPKSIRILQMLRDSLFRDVPEAPDLNAVDQIIEGSTPEARGNMAFFVGWCLREHGKPEDARAYLERCTHAPNTLNWFRIIAADALRVPGGDREPAKVNPRTSS
jgi:hypothetical protein